jgi:hypothetical protein
MILMIVYTRPSEFQKGVIGAVSPASEKATALQKASFIEQFRT